MVRDDLQAVLSEIVALSESVPEPYREKCFEILLINHLSPGRASKELAEHEGTEIGAPVPGEDGGEDIQLADIHVKARSFLKKNDLGIQDLNQLFYAEDGEFKSLYDDLHTTMMSEAQIRISLLQALVSGMQTGNFVFDKADVRSESQQRKCHDQANFAANYKTNEVLFESYDPKAKTLTLSTKGKEKLAAIARELA